MLLYCPLVVTHRLVSYSSWAFFILTSERILRNMVTLVFLIFVCVFFFRSQTRRNWKWTDLQPCPVRGQCTAKSASNFTGGATTQTPVNFYFFFFHQIYPKKWLPSHPSNYLWMSPQASVPSSQEPSQEKENAPSLATPVTFGHHPPMEMTAGQWTRHIPIPSWQLLFHTSLCFLMSISSLLAFSPFFSMTLVSVLLYSKMFESKFKGRSIMWPFFTIILTTCSNSCFTFLICSALIGCYAKKPFSFFPPNVDKFHKIIRQTKTCWDSVIDTLLCCCFLFCLYSDTLALKLKWNSSGVENMLNCY